jgi:aminoglycoside phosphotransferase (APT) family kinase protein
MSELTRVLGSACPGLNLCGVRLVGTGFGSIVLETGDGLILRVARTAAAARGHAIEAATLPHLAPSLPLAVPAPCLSCPPTRELPFGAIGYEKLDGQPCLADTATVATSRDLGNFLAVLHQLDIRAFPAMPDQHAVWRAWHRLRDDTAAILRDRLTSSENQRISQWWEHFLSDRAMREYRPAVRHGDLWHGNLLIRPDGSITAVLDWEAVATADPAQDLALTRYLGAGFTACVLDAYRTHDGAYDDQIEYRTEVHWQLRELTGLPLAAAVGDQDEVAECIAKLRAEPIFNPVQ